MAYVVLCDIEKNPIYAKCLNYENHVNFPPFGEKGQKSKGLPIAPPVLEYPAMSADFREDAIVKLRAELFTIPRILSRLPQISWRGFPMSHITSWMIQYPQGRAFKQFAREREELQRKGLIPDSQTTTLCK